MARGLWQLLRSAGGERRPRRADPRPQPEQGPQPGPGLAVTVVDSPPPEDEIVVGEEVEVAVEANAAEVLADKELDATVSGEQVNFTIGEQAA